MRNLALLLTVSLFLALPPRGRSDGVTTESSSPAETSLFAQSAARALTRDFPSDNVSFLLIDANSGAVLAARWANPEAPIPLGSLVKPFTALAYGEQHNFHFPTHVCRGIASGCWLPRGHGSVDLISAIAYSCNSYFRMLTANLTAAELAPTAEHFALQPPSAELSGAALAGLGNRWAISPLSMARAYLELIHRRDQPGVREILMGMAQSAQHGTGAAVGRAVPFHSAFVKTGTAACTHARHGPGDGFVVAIAPADQPRFLLMVRVHGIPGAQAAKTAGQMLRRIEE